jgi:hypothetical protein
MGVGDYSKGEGPCRSDVLLQKATPAAQQALKEFPPAMGCIDLVNRLP